jgi:hypothetical protein
MQIDRSIVDAHAAGLISPADIVQAVCQLEFLVLERIRGEAVAHGFPAVLVDFAIEEQRLKLLAQRPSRVDMLRQMLEAGATSVQ